MANSTISDNSGSRYAGGIFAGRTQVDISDSTIADNQLDATVQWGAGGIYLTGGSRGTLRGSTISGNNADGGSDYGSLTGGVYTWDSSVSMINCTVSGNSASGPDLTAGGVSNSYSSYDAGNGYGLTLISTTISGNSTSATSGSSSGGLLLGGYGIGGAVLQNTILSGNTGGSDRDFFANNGAATASHSLLGSSQAGNFGGNGNVFNDNPGLSSLANNGGLTFTMALQMGSPAIDVGDNALIPGGVQYDQRGIGFPRILNGIVDLGSIEYGTSGTGPPTASTSIAVPSSSMWSKGLLGLLAGMFGLLTLTRRQRRGQRA